MPMPVKTKKLFTLVLIHDKKNHRVLLGKKKRGIGVGLYNGFGGKVEKENDADVVASALRELREEARVAPDGDLARRAVLTFNFEDLPSEVWETHVFTGAGIVAEPQETEEMEPRWFGVDEIPYEQMWLDDRYWLPLVLGQKKHDGEGEGEGEKAATTAAETEAEAEADASEQNVIGEFFFKASSGPGSKVMTKHELRAVPASGLPPLPSW